MFPQECTRSYPGIIDNFTFFQEGEGIRAEATNKRTRKLAIYHLQTGIDEISSHLENGGWVATVQGKLTFGIGLVGGARRGLANLGPHCVLTNKKTLASNIRGKFLSCVVIERSDIVAIATEEQIQIRRLSTGAVHSRYDVQATSLSVLDNHHICYASKSRVGIIDIQQQSVSHFTRDYLIDLNCLTPLLTTVGNNRVARCYHAFNGNITIWNTNTKVISKKIQSDESIDTLFSVGNNSVAAISDGKILIWDIDSNIEEPIVITSANEGHKPTGEGISLDDRTIITNCKDGRLRLWRISTKACIQEFPEESGGRWVRNLFKVSNSTFATCPVDPDKLVRIWDKNGTCKTRIRNPQNGPSCMSRQFFAPLSQGDLIGFGFSQVVRYMTEEVAAPSIVDEEDGAPGPSNAPTLGSVNNWSNLDWERFAVSWCAAGEYRQSLPNGYTTFCSEQEEGETRVWHKIDDEKKVQIIGFRASANVLNWINNIQLSSSSIDTISEHSSEDVSSYTVHSGFLSEYNSIRDRLLAIPLHNSHKIVVTGHSQGGALATLFVADIFLNGYTRANQVALVTFGSPRACNRKLAKWIDELGLHKNIRVQISGDPVTTLPAQTGETFWHRGQQVTLDDSWSTTFTRTPIDAVGETSTPGNRIFSFTRSINYVIPGFGSLLTSTGRITIDGVVNGVRAITRGSIDRVYALGASRHSRYWEAY